MAGCADRAAGGERLRVVGCSVVSRGYALSLGRGPLNEKQNFNTEDHGAPRGSFGPMRTRLIFAGRRGTRRRDADAIDDPVSPWCSVVLRVKSLPRQPGNRTVDLGHARCGGRAGGYRCPRRLIGQTKIARRACRSHQVDAQELLLQPGSPPIVVSRSDPVIRNSTVPREITGSGPVMTRRGAPHSTRSLLVIA